MTDLISQKWWVAHNLNHTMVTNCIFFMGCRLYHFPSNKYVYDNLISSKNQFIFIFIVFSIFLINFVRSKIWKSLGSETYFAFIMHYKVSLDLMSDGFLPIPTWTLFSKVGDSQFIYRWNFNNGDWYVPIQSITNEISQ